MGRDPSVTWNPATNEFGVAFSGETYSGFAAVPAWNAAAFRRNTFNVGGGKLTAMTDIAYNPASGRYVMAWYEISSGNFAKVAEFDASGALMTTGIASARLGSYDAFSMALNQVSFTFLMVGLDRVSDRCWAWSWTIADTRSMVKTPSRACAPRGIRAFRQARCRGRGTWPSAARISAPCRT